MNKEKLYQWVPVVEIWATGMYRFCYVELPNGKIKKLAINDKEYKEFKKYGVPTAQSRRKKQ